MRIPSRRVEVIEKESVTGCENCVPDGENVRMSDFTVISPEALGGFGSMSTPIFVVPLRAPAGIVTPAPFVSFTALSTSGDITLSAFTLSPSISQVTWKGVERMSDSFDKAVKPRDNAFF